MLNFRQVILRVLSGGNEVLRPSRKGVLCLVFVQIREDLFVSRGRW